MAAKIVLISLIVSISCGIHARSLPVLKRSVETVKTEYTIGDDIILNCEADGTMSPIFHWLHNGQYIEQSPLDVNARNLITSPVSHVRVVQKASLLIKKAKVEDSGKYTCIADSLTKRVVRSFTITVTEPQDKQRGSSESNASPLRIYQYTDEVWQTEEEPMYVVCRATQGVTESTPIIRWSIDGRTIEESENIKIHSNGDLEVKSVRYEDFDFMQKGYLKCSAINEDGTSTVHKNTYIYVLERETSQR